MGLSTLGNLGLSEADATHRRIGSTFIVDYGIVKAIPADGIVTVEMSATKDKQSIIITNCVLASFASSSFSVNIKPNINDKVMVLFPKNYSSRMFDVENNEPIISMATSGYCLLGGVAILLNQFQDFHKNYIDLSDGCVELKLAYSENDETNLLVLTTNDKGEIKLITNNTSVDISKDDEITIDNGKATITIDSSGNVKVETNGKYTFKNNSTDLKSVVDGLAQELENLTTVGSPATQATSPASKTTIATWRNTKLNLLLD